MKSIHKIVLFIFIVSFSACTSFLVEVPKDSRSSSNSYQDEAGVKAGLLGIYEGYYDMYIHSSVPFIGELGTDEAYCTFNSIDLRLIDTYALSPQNTQTLPDWYMLNYKVISRANVLIGRTKANIAYPSTEILKMIAEAKVMRAWCYFRLAQTFGPVVIIKDEVIAPVDYGLSRAPLKDVYEQIVNDLKEATNELILPTARNSSSPVRVTHWVAKAMLGKVYLTMASSKEAGVIDRLMTKIGKPDFGFLSVKETKEQLYALAQTTLKDIIDNSGIALEPDYRKLFVWQYKNTIAENMWELQANDGIATSNPGKGFFLFNYGGSGGGSALPKLNGLFNKKMLSGGALLIRSEGGYQEDDLRKAWVLNGGYKSLVKGVMVPQYAYAVYSYANKKYSFLNYTVERQESDWKILNIFYSGVTKFRFNINDSLQTPTVFNDASSLPLNFTVIRYADVVLMYAEACYKVNSNTADAETVRCMNLIRDRARGTTLHNILNERKLELCFESIRWFDLARTGKLIEIFNNPATSSTGQQQRPLLTDEKCYLLPIPQNQIDVSTDKTGFFQNCGY
jgi:hypothetical protein